MGEDRFGRKWVLPPTRNDSRDKGALAKDDRLDALAMAVAYWSKALAVETEKVVQRKREEMMQAELERYMAHAIGYRPKGRLYATTGHER